MATWSQHLLAIKLVPNLESNPRALAFAMTPAGKLAFAIAAMLAAYLWGRPEWPLVGATIAATSFLPQFRAPILALACFCLSLLACLEASTGWLPLTAYPIALLYCLMARRWAATPLFRHPVRTLLLLYIAAIALLQPTPGAEPSTAWRMLLAFGAYLWFVAYAVQAKPPGARGQLVIDVVSFPRIWGSTFVPYPKGQSYLERFAAKDAAQLARTQLKGIKLMLWSAWIWAFLQIVLGALPLEQASNSAADVPVVLQLHSSQALVAAWANRQPYAWHISWLSLFVEQFVLILSYAFMGHKIISLCRLCGYDVLRNTYKPIYARSIVEFYNRFYFYFKELLAEFFFFPTYLQLPRKWPRLRMFIATLAAAGSGNFLYHFLRDIDRLQLAPLMTVLQWEKTHAFYCAVLALAIAISQLRNTGKRHAAAMPDRHDWLWKPFSIYCFFSLLAVFDTSHARFDFSQYIGFAIHLVLPWTTPA